MATSTRGCETPAMKFEMQWIWRIVFLFLAGAGLAALGWGAAGLAGLVEAEESRGELMVCVAVGILMQPFAWTGLRHARLVITDTELVYLGFGLWCTARRVELAEIERFGVGTERSSQGGREKILLIELRSGGIIRIKLQMYRGQSRFLEALGRATGLEQSATGRSWTGARFAESE